MASTSLSNVLINIKNIGLTPVKQGNKYSVLFENGNNLEFLSGTMQENIASNFSINGRLVNKNINFDEIFKRCLDGYQHNPNMPKFEEKENKKMSDKSNDISQAAANFAATIMQNSLNKDTLEALEKKIENLENTLKENVKVIQINDMPKIDLEQNASEILEDLLRAAHCRQNAYIFGPAGCGKTTAAKQVAKVMNLPFGYICLTAGASETWLFGRNTPNGFIEGEFSKIYKNGGVFLADEMDAADSNLLIALNTAIDSDELLNPMSGEKIKRHENFIFIGAGNTNGLGATGAYNGRSRLDASTLSRFVFFEMNYNEKIEKALCQDDDLFNSLIEIRNYLKNRNSENFISTRDFIKLSKMKAAGSSDDFLINSLTCNFSETEKSECAILWVRSEKKRKAKPKKEMVQDEIPF